MSILSLKLMIKITGHQKLPEMADIWRIPASVLSRHGSYLFRVAGNTVGASHVAGETLYSANL